MVLKRLPTLLSAALVILAAAASARAQEIDGAGPQLVSAKAATAAKSEAEQAISGHYVVRRVDDKNLWLDPPELPDLRGYTDEAVLAKVPASKGNPHLETRRMVESQTLHEFVGGRNRLGEWAARQHSNPVALFLSGGKMTPADLAKALPAEQFEETSKGVYLLKLPLVIAPGATLHIDRATREFRMSEERGAFIVNDGLLVISHTRVTGWRESANGAATYKSPNDFRPFIISWGGAEMYVTRSTFASLGYEASKSFGLSISQYSPNMDAVLKRKRPTGWVINSEFNDMYYGFYCYQADNVVVFNNTYKDSIIYGIDPHDYSNHLVIAHNTVSGSKKKHGIIVSREVNDSWLIWNRSTDNNLSGLVIDRKSVRNVIAYNDLFNNKGDGITIYESPNNLVWNNRASHNNQHGIRLRNSLDNKLYGNIAVANRLAGIFGHVKDLAGMDRNLKVDPYETKISMVVVGGQLIFNGSGPLSIDKPLSLELYGVDMLAPTKRNGIQLTGVLGEFQQDVLDILVRQRGALVIEPRERAGEREVTPAQPQPEAPAQPS